MRVVVKYVCRSCGAEWSRDVKATLAAAMPFRDADRKIASRCNSCTEAKKD